MSARPGTSFVGAATEFCYWTRPMSAREPAVPREASLARLALEHLDGLFRVARRLTGSHEDAEDLVQETFSRALGGRSQFTPGSNLRAWLFRILRNCHIDAYRRTRTSPVLAAMSDREPDEDVAARVSDPVRGDEELDRMRGLVAGDIEIALASLSIAAPGRDSARSGGPDRDGTGRGDGLQRRNHQPASGGPCGAARAAQRLLEVMRTWTAAKHATISPIAEADASGQEERSGRRAPRGVRSLPT